MKIARILFLVTGLALITSSCGMLSRPKYGCGTDGKNVGAEKLLSNPPKKTPKFKA